VCFEVKHNSNDVDLTYLSHWKQKQDAFTPVDTVRRNFYAVVREIGSLRGTQTQGTFWPDSRNSTLDNPYTLWQ